MAPVDEKRMKAAFKEKAGIDPFRYYPVEILSQEGFTRRQCPKCRTYFWAAGERDVCGEPGCSGGYSFIGDSPAKKRMDFIQTWQEFSRLFKDLGYTPIQRYPVAARWRDDTDFVQASIYDFQPYVVSGEIEPPANPLVVPQFCLRFNDVDNVGYTGRHYTGFVMIGQHAFEPPERYDPPLYLEHIYKWLVKGMGIPKEELQFHEDTWAGGGNMGPSMEFFSRGLEIGNQVYMQYDIRKGTAEELAIKVLDMGMGQERPAWFTHGTATSYEANFGTAIKRLYKVTDIRPDQELIKEFLPYSGMLNFDEADDIEIIWDHIARKMNVDLVTLKKEVIPLASLYSVADHSRSLLVALTDGSLPSNVGGGYNLRSLLRRSLDIISHNDWDLELIELCTWHADYLKPQYPELHKNLDEVAEILAVEMRKHRETRKKSKRVVSGLKDGIDLDRLITLYDSQGITPQMVADAGVKVDVPPDFYSLVSDRHEKAQKKRVSTKKEFLLPLEDIPRTEILYYDDYLRLSFKAKVLKIIDDQFVILDRTAFYPTSGGQLHDKGSIDDSEVLEVFKQGSVVVHVVKKPDFKVGEEVTSVIDRDRRVQLAQNHTATHILNGVSRELLGDHIWQAGAEKTPSKARLDITHYEALDEDILLDIELKANEVVRKDYPVESLILKRDKAEGLYGFRLYQGGAVPGKELRIVKVDGLDVEACGGTHLHHTGEARLIKVIGSSKIQDGVVRLEYTAGAAAIEYVKENIFGVSIRLSRSLLDSGLVSDLTSSLEIRKKDGEEWMEKISSHTDLAVIQSFDKELKECSKLFSVPPGKLVPTLKRFLEEAEQYGPKPRRKEELNDLRNSLTPLFQGCLDVFNLWKKGKKSSEKAKKEALDTAFEGKMISGYELVIKEIKGGSKDALNTAKSLAGEKRIVFVFAADDKGVSVVGLRKDAPIDTGAIVKEVSRILGGGGGGRPDFGQGAGTDKSGLGEALKRVEERIIGSLA